VLDVIAVLDRAFRNVDAMADPLCAPHQGTIDGRTDVDCSGATDIVDVTRMISVAFRGLDPESEFCQPCQP
jgi:hypothetical protein